MKDGKTNLMKCVRICESDARLTKHKKGNCYHTLLWWFNQKWAEAACICVWYPACAERQVLLWSIGIGRWVWNILETHLKDKSADWAYDLAIMCWANISWNHKVKPIVNKAQKPWLLRHSYLLLQPEKFSKHDYENWFHKKSVPKMLCFLKGKCFLWKQCCWIMHLHWEKLDEFRFNILSTNPPVALFGRHRHYSCQHKLAENSCNWSYLRQHWHLNWNVILPVEWIFVFGSLTFHDSEIDPHLMVFSGSAQYYLHGEGKSQNSRYWSSHVLWIMYYIQLHLICYRPFWALVSLITVFRLSMSCAFFHQAVHFKVLRSLLSTAWLQYWCMCQCR